MPSTGFLRPPAGGPRPVRIIGCLGPMSRDLDDLELALRAISGPDGHDSDVPPVPLSTQKLRRPLQDLRLAVAPALPGATIARELRQQVERVASAASDAGAKVDERLPDVDWQAQYQLFGDLLMAITGVYDPTANLRDEQRTLAWYLDALHRRDGLIATWESFFVGLDGLIMPPAITTAFTHREPGVAFDVDGTSVSYNDNGLVYAFSNLAGLPAITAPSEVSDEGLPIGIQIVGPRWSEMRLLAVARKLEKADVLPGFQPPPPRAPRSRSAAEDGPLEGTRS